MKRSEFARPTAIESMRPRGQHGMRAAHAITVLGLVGLGLFVHRENFSYGLTAGDSYPQILTSRIQSFGDLLDTFREPLAEDLILAAFYRPVQNLSIAFDYACWGLNPFGYQLTTMVLFGACIALLYLTARRLLGGTAWLAPLVATLFWTLHPALLNVLPAPCRRSELLVVAFLLAALLVLPVRSDKRFWRRCGLAGFFVLLAAGSKEIGTIGLGLVFLHQLLLVGHRRFTRSLKRATLAALPAALAVIAYMVNRIAIMGLLGGYDAEPKGAYAEWLAFSSGQLLIDVLCPWSFLPSLPPLQLACLSLAMLGLSAVRVVGLGELARSEGLRCAGRVTVIGVAWIAPIVLLLGVNQRYGPWYALMPLGGLALILAGLVRGSGLMFAHHGAQRVSGVVVAGCVLIVAVVSLWASPLHTDYPHWRDATRLLNEAQTRIDEKLRNARPGQSIDVEIVPRVSKPARRDRLRELSPPRPPLYAVGIWKLEGLHAWIRLRYPDKPVQAVYARDPDPPAARPDRIYLLVELDRSEVD